MRSLFLGVVPHFTEFARFLQRLLLIYLQKLTKTPKQKHLNKCKTQQNDTR